VWAHGDFCVVHPVTGNISFLGRADGVLNPSGVRFGSAEIYSVLERHFADRVQDSLCVGQRRKQDSDESVMLFLLMKPGVKFDRALVNQVRQAISADLSKRHVPRYIFETPEIPVSFACLLSFPLSAAQLRESMLIAIRQPSTSKKSSCPSSRSCPGTPSKRAARWLTRKVSSTTTSLPRWRSWLGPRRSCNHLLVVGRRERVAKAHVELDADFSTTIP
jgi:hypothetical protein